MTTNSPESSNSLLISVVLCTFNRADLLAVSLQALAEQILENSEYEVVVVDNNSTDNTQKVVEEMCNRLTGLRYCFEPIQGLSHARNRGWQEAKGEYVAYIDDDCRVPGQWLTVAKKIIEQISPDVFGGPYFAFYNSPKPVWFKDSYGSRDRGKEPRVLGTDEYLDGTNIFFRRSLLKEMGGFNPDLGMSGKTISYGEETALLRRIRGKMPHQIIYYDPQLYVYHLVMAEKMSLAWNVRQRFAGGRAAYKTFIDDSERHKANAAFMFFLAKILLFFLDSTLGVVFRNYTTYPYFRNYLYERAFRHLTSIGFFFEHLRFSLCCRTTSNKRS